MIIRSENKMKTSLSTVVAIAIASATSFADGTKLTFAGYAGNSGGVLVGSLAQSQSSPYSTPAVGPVYDSQKGLLYSSAGQGKINAYRLDGTCVASYSLPGAEPFARFDSMTICANRTIFILAGGARMGQGDDDAAGGILYRLALDAPDGSAAEVVTNAPPCNALSMSDHDGKVVLHSRVGPIYEMDTATLEWKQVGTRRTGGGLYLVCMMDWDPDGAMRWVYEHNNLWTFAPDYTFAKDPQALFGRELAMLRGRIIDDEFWVLCGSDSIKRLDSHTFEPKPGIVFGGGSGFFIGHVRTNGEINGSGICKISDNLYAFSGCNNGCVYLLRWNETRRQMEEVRRIGALTETAIPAIDPTGRFFYDGLIWDFDDAPSAPPKDTHIRTRPLIHAEVRPGLTVGICHTSFNRLVAYGGNAQNGFAQFWRELGVGDFGAEPEGAGSIVRHANGIYEVIRIGCNGQCMVATFAENGAVREDIPFRHWALQLPWDDAVVSSVSTLPDGRALAFVNRKLIWIERDGDGMPRFGEQFAAKIRGDQVAVDGDKFAVIDTEAGELRLYDLANGSLLATHGGLKEPARVAFCNGRIIIYERAAQRIAKFLCDNGD